MNLSMSACSRTFFPSDLHAMISMPDVCRCQWSLDIDLVDPALQATSTNHAGHEFADLWMSSVSALNGVLDVFVWAQVLHTRTVLEPNGFTITLKIMVGYRCTCTKKTKREDQTLDI